MDRKNKNYQTSKSRMTSGEENGNSIFAALPPQNVELEKAILGVILMESNAFDLASEILRADCFYDAKNKTIWKTCEEVYRKGYNIDLLIIADELKKNDEITHAEWVYYL